MKTLATLLLLVATSLAAACSTTSDSATTRPAATRESHALMDAEMGFYDALNRLFKGEMEPMERVWSRSDDVTYLSPTGEFLVGRDRVMAAWRSQAQQKLGGSVEPRDIHIFLERDAQLGVAQNFEHATGQTVGTFTIRATNVFRKEGGRWMMVSHHADVIPALADAH
jgi:ketosteroid isomerase-like protein